MAINLTDICRFISLWEVRRIWFTNLFFSLRLRCCCFASSLLLPSAILAQFGGHEVIKALYAHVHSWAKYYATRRSCQCFQQCVLYRTFLRAIHITSPSSSCIRWSVLTSPSVSSADATVRDVMHPKAPFQNQRGLATLIKRSCRRLEVSEEKGTADMRFFDTKIIKDVQESRHGNGHTETPSPEFKHVAPLLSSVARSLTCFCLFLSWLAQL